MSPPVAAVGETNQHQRIVVRRVDADRLTLKWAARCADVGVERAARVAPAVFSANDDTERLLTLTRDGDRYTGRGRWREDGTDGDYDLVTVTATARLADRGGRVTGSLRAEWKTWNGESRAFDATCASGVVSWSARPGTPARAPRPHRLDGWITGEATATDGHRVWALLRPSDIMSADPYRLARIDGATGVVASIQPVDIRHTLSGLQPTMAYVDGSLWISRPDYGAGARCTIDVVDPVTAAVTRTFPVCARFVTPTSGGEVWASSYVRDVGPRVIVIDARTGAVTAQLDIGDPTAMAAAGDRVWVKPNNDELKLVVRATRGVAVTVDIARYPTLSGAADGGVWVTEASRRAPSTWHVMADGRPQRVELPAPADAVAATADGGAWFVSTVDLTARRVDASGRVTRTVDLPDRAWWALAMADGGLVAATDHGVVRVDDDA